MINSQRRVKLIGIIVIVIGVCVSFLFHQFNKGSSKDQVLNETQFKTGKFEEPTQNALPTDSESTPGVEGENVRPATQKSFKEPVDLSDITKSFKITRSELTKNKLVDVYEMTVSITNVSNTVFKGPIQVLVSNLPEDTTVANSQGVTLEGRRYVLFVGFDDTLGPSETREGLIQFEQTKQGIINPGLSVHQNIPKEYSLKAEGIEITKIEFMESGGRPGHGGTFPIQESEPPANTTLVMRAVTFDHPTSVKYRFLDIHEKVITSGDMQVWNEMDSFVAGAKIPSEPFQIELSGITAEGRPFAVQSEYYYPTNIRLKLAPKSALLKKGENFELKIQSEATVLKYESYTVRLNLPEGFHGDVGPWEIQPKIGQVTEIKTDITTPVNGEEYERYPITVTANSSQDSTHQVITSSFDLLVE